MSNQAHYLLSSGLIASTLSPGISDPAQIAGLREQGIGVVAIPDGKNGGSGMIDLASGQYVDYAPQPAPVPDIMLQYIAAQINAGKLDAGAFHPVSLIQLNAQLSMANMSTVEIATGVTVKPVIS
jgi:hypothetical protein